VRVSNLAGGFTESGPGILVVTDPYIVTPPENRTSLEGDATSFTVVAAGTDLTYQWKRNGDVLAGATASYTQYRLCL